MALQCDRREFTRGNVIAFTKTDHYAPRPMAEYWKDVDEAELWSIDSRSGTPRKAVKAIGLAVIDVEGSQYLAQALHEDDCEILMTEITPKECHVEIRLFGPEEKRYHFCVCGARDPLKGFIAYSHRDEDLKRELQTHLYSLRSKVEFWSDEEQLAGAEWERKIEERLAQAEVVILLLTPEFFKSDFCQHEMRTALNRYRSDAALVIPVLVRNVFFKASEVAALQVLPRNRRPVVNWEDRNDAYVEIAEEIERALAARSR